MSLALEQFDLAETNAMLEHLDPPKVIEWAHSQFNSGLAMSSSFGAESAVLLHMASVADPSIRVIFVDTGYLFPETHEFLSYMRDRLKLNVLIYRTRNDPAEYLKRAGETDPTWRNNIDACCAANKNEPFDRAMREIAPRAWLRGIRRDQAPTRTQRQFIEWSTRFQCYAVSPLLNWSNRQIHGYLKSHGLPTHPLWEKGYASIGCNPLSCTRAIGAEDDPRSGRWAGANKFECGINVINSLDSANL
jgi:phosphoadenosine phosphosulfate reductase